jgi:hypothetical protein
MLLWKILNFLKFTIQKNCASILLRNGEMKRASIANDAMGLNTFGYQHVAVTDARIANGKPRYEVVPQWNVASCHLCTGYMRQF